MLKASSALNLSGSEIRKQALHSPAPLAEGDLREYRNDHWSLSVSCFETYAGLVVSRTQLRFLVLLA